MSNTKEPPKNAISKIATEIRTIKKVKPFPMPSVSRIANDAVTINQRLAINPIYGTYVRIVGMQYA